jgi:hypothetical protein
MIGYPEELLPQKTYSVLYEEDVSSFFFIRETKYNLYEYLDQNLDKDDIIRKIIEPQASEREVFDLSLFLYGYYYEDHCGIRVSDESLYNLWTNNMPYIHFQNINYIKKDMFPLYLKARTLYNRSINYNEEQFILSFSHRPTRANYWHFQLWTKNEKTGEYIPREKKRLKNLAKHILEQYIINAICPQSETIKFKFT